MKATLTGIWLVILMFGMISTAAAEPQRIQLKDSVKKAKESAAKTQIKNMDLRDIEDPAAQEAIQEIINYLGLKTQN